MKKIKVGIVNYLNTRPLLYGIQHSAVMNEIELVGDYPSNIAGALISGDIDLGLVPVAIIPTLKEHYIITDYCIGCDGAVASVCLFSEVPLEKVERILLDYQSRTSVELAKILLRDYWKIKPELVAATADYRESIKGNTAGLVIGDRSFEQRKISPYIYDLGQAWKDYTGLPFVFAAWVSNKPLEEGFIKSFNQSNKEGICQVRKIIEQEHYNLFDLETYYTKHIQYHFDGDKKKALEMFLKKVKGEG